MSAPANVTSQACYDDLYCQIKAMVVTKSVSGSTVMVLASKAMQIAGTFTSLSGLEKKDLVVSAVSAVVHDLIEDLETIKISDEVRSMLLAAVDMLPTIVDQTIAVGKALYEKDTDVSTGKRCFCA